MKRLEDDSRYNLAKEKLVSLQLGLKELETERDICLGRINDLSHAAKKSKLDAQAEALINGNQSTIDDLVDIKQSLEQITQRISVQRRAIELQRKHIEVITSEVSKTISREMLPQHKKIVQDVVKKLLALDQALQSEHGLRDELHQAGIQYQTHIRPMPIHRIGTTTDPQSAISRYLLECLEHNFITTKDVPEHLHKYIQSKGGEVKQDTPEHDPDGWSMA